MRQLLLCVLFLALGVAGWSASGPINRVRFVWLDTGTTDRLNTTDRPTATVTTNTPVDNPGGVR
jgi:hypothetical protein